MEYHSINKIPKIRPFLLWDVDLKNFDYIDYKRIVIERVCMLGDLNDFLEIVRFYGMETIKEELLQSVELDKKTLNFFSQYFKIPEDKFKCYTRKAFLFQS